MFHRKSVKAILLPAGIFLSIMAVIVVVVCVLHFGNEDEDKGTASRRESRTQRREEGSRNKTERSDSGVYEDVTTSADIDGKNGGSAAVESDSEEDTPVNIVPTKKDSGETTLSDIMVALDAYNEYIDQAVKNQLWEVDYYGGSGPSAFVGCDLIYVDNEDIPVVFIYDPADYYGSGDYIILTYDEGQVHEQVLNFYYDENPYSILFPKYMPYSDGENFGPVYKTVYDSYFGKVLKFNHILGCFGNPLVALDSWEPAALCSEFMLMSLTYARDITEYYPDVYMNSNKQGNQISISEEDVSDYLMHTIGVADTSEWMQYVNQDTNDFQIDISYADGEYIITVPWSFLERHWESYLDPVITEIRLLSDSELQISGLIENYLEHDRTAFRYTYFTVRMALDADSVWNYRLLGIDRWDSYMLPYAHLELLHERDVHYLTTEQLEFAIKEIYARHGMIFKDEQVQEYFENCNWYNATVPEAIFDDSVLNMYEYCNVHLLTRYMNNRDCNWYKGMHPEFDYLF